MHWHAPLLCRLLRQPGLHLVHGQRPHIHGMAVLVGLGVARARGDLGQRSWGAGPDGVQQKRA